MLHLASVKSPLLRMISYSGSDPAQILLIDGKADAIHGGCILPEEIESKLKHSNTYEFNAQLTGHLYRKKDL